MFLGTYSYYLLANTIASYNQIGIKFINVLTLFGLIVSSFDKNYIDRIKMYMFSPSGCLLFLSPSYNSQSYDQTSTYTTICFYQIIIPLLLSCFI